MIKNKKEKQGVLKDILKQLSGRVAKNDLEPKTKMVIKAEGDNPEEIKEEVIEKLQKIDLPGEEEMAEMEEEMPECLEEECLEEECMEEEGEEMEEEEDEDDFLSELPEGMRKALMNKLK